MSRKGKRTLVFVYLLLGSLGFTGCIYRGESTYCPTGMFCPPGLSCAAKQPACIYGKCGNGTLDKNEVCDDGNILDGDGCSHDCKSNEICGNGIVDAARGEECDDGDTVDGDGCSHDCKVEGCGNGKLDPGEDCDSGPSGTHNVAKETATCNSDCTTPRHGDGKVNQDFGEQCDGDDHGNANGVSCESATCNSDCTPSKHGDGKVNPSAGEQCDGNDLGLGNGHDCESDICNYNCTLSKCGDGIVNVSAGEECDRDGMVGHDGQRGTDGHSATCTPDCKRSTCGDNYVNTLAGEECDLGDGKNSDSGDCLASCKVASCGDGNTNTARDAYGKPKEECDTGANNSDTGACLTNCHNATCGDGHIWEGHEQCDDGTSSATVKSACPYGQKSCSLCSQCQLVPLTGPYCGDKVQNGDEACDDGPNNGNTACAYGTRTCQICNATCKGYRAATGPFCGDGTKDAKYGEACDEGPDNGATSCAGKYGQQTCTVCSADCKTPKQLQEEHCGDGYQNGPPKTEDCDDLNSFACGRCGKPGTEEQCKTVLKAVAAGSISVASPSSTALVGVTIQLDDGISQEGPRRFELVNGGQAHAGNIAVDISSGSGIASAATIAQRLANAVTAQNTLSSPFMIVATPPPEGSATVSLANGAAGLFGNHQIVVKPGNTSAITTIGMAGGNGCPLGQMCASSYDCARGSCSNDTPGVCK